MATAPYFIISPNTVVSTLGLLRGPDKTVPTPAEDWRQAKVDVVIPALNEEINITLALASVARQTLKPRQIIIVDDGSADRTPQFAREFAAANGMKLEVISRQASIGKTPTLKKQSRLDDADVEFILDGDTLLESENYIERVVQELYQGVGIASACGTILPMRTKDRRPVLEGDHMLRFIDAHPEVDFRYHDRWPARLRRALTNVYRRLLYLYLQRFIYHGQMVFFGTITNPVGCAVAYRRQYLKDLFDQYEPILGDDLTNSEDIFIGFALLHQGYRNIQLTDVYARTIEPEVQRLPRQIYLWSSSFLQTCYYFDDLVRSPFKVFKRWRRRRQEKASGQAEEIAKRRKIAEAYRQPFGAEHTRNFGRPMGWMILTSLAEKIGFPVALLIMLILQLWEPLAITALAETLLMLIVLLVISRGSRLRSFLQGLVIAPLRYVLLAADLITIGRFALDLWVTRNRKWRK